MATGVLTPDVTKRVGGVGSSLTGALGKFVGAIGHFAAGFFPVWLVSVVLGLVVVGVVVVAVVFFRYLRRGPG